jgi:RNA-binding protein
MMAPTMRRAEPARRRPETPETVPMSGKQKRALRARAHHLSPVVSIGSAGATEGLLAELENALDVHELVKLRIAAEDRAQRKQLIDTVCERANAELVQRIGHTAVIFRKRPEDQAQT